VDRPLLAADMRLIAIFELAQDYLKAGLLDRAEEMFLKLQDTSYSQQALKFLLEIYEQEKEWQKAITTSRRMDESTGQSSAKDIAHFYCELASVEMTHSRWELARGYLDEALGVNRKCTRANLLHGELEFAQGHCAAAINAWKRIEGQNPAYLALCAERLSQAYRQINRIEEGLQLLRSYLANYA
jgi:lipopolysaccharide biosynthesis regulator YciM